MREAHKNRPPIRTSAFSQETLLVVGYGQLTNGLEGFSVSRISRNIIRYVGSDGTRFDKARFNNFERLIHSANKMPGLVRKLRSAGHYVQDYNFGGEFNIRQSEIRYILDFDLAKFDQLLDEK